MAPKRKRSASPSDSVTMSYQVFLSFRGPDTRQGFTDVLYHDLTDAGIRVFRDNEEIRKGEEIGDEILTAIDQSRVFVPIFSKGYASSKWCLIELAKMSESVRASSGKKKILPIFYDVSVDDVKLKTDLYQGALAEHKMTGKFNTDTIQRWEEALCGAGRIKGYELKNQGFAEFAKPFVKEVSSMLKVKHTLVTDYLVERDDQVKDLTELLDIDSPGVRFVGIHGMGGIGKTTLAGVVFNKLCDSFDQSCFLADVRESIKRKGIENLQQQFLEKAGLKSGEISHKDEGIIKLSGMLRGKGKILLVLDDIGHNEQLKYLAGDATWFSSGSRILVTTRDKGVLRADVQTFEAESMKPKEALRLFSLHAFDQDSPPSDYLSLSEDVVESTGQLPLALEVIGSYLWGKHEKTYWVRILRRLKKAPHDDVEKSLMISYEGLKDEAKQIFQDIATFFIGYDKEYPMYMWEASGFDPDEGLEDLINLSLVKVVLHYDWRKERYFEKLWMHDQLRDMGRKIACKTRIWKEEEALQVVQRQEPNKDIEMLRLNHSEKRDMEVSVSGLCFPNLRCLICMGRPVTRLEVKGPLPRLTWLSLSGCKLVGRDFWVDSSSGSRNNMAVLQFHNCSIPQDWEGWSQIGASTHLRVLDFRYTINVTRLPPDLPSSLTNLILKRSEITELHSSIGKLENLKKLDISGTRIMKLPASIRMLKSLEALNASHCSLLEEIPPQIEGCTCLRVLKFGQSGLAQLPPNLPISLTNLILENCKITELPSSIGILENLKKLDIRWTRIKKLPASIGMLKSLEALNVSRCYSLEKIPLEIEGCTCLKVLNFECSGLTRFPPNLPISLTRLILKRCKITELPSSIGKLENLKELDISSTRIKKLPAFIGMLKSLEELDASNCSSLKEITQEIEGCTCLRVLKFSGRGLGRLPPNLPSSLRSLIISNYKMNELPSSIGKLENLKNLDIFLTDIKKLPASIGMLKSLEELNAFGCSSLEEIPPQIEGCTCLRILKFNHSGLARFPRNLPISLRTLIIDSCKITELPSSIGILENLKKLEISWTRIKKLPASIGMLKSLEELKASYCYSLEEIPPQIEGCTCLKVLTFSGSGLARFPPNLPISLTYLTFESCKITELPSSIAELENLKKLNISSTGIKKLPASIGILKSLEELDVSCCSSLEEIPPQIEGCTCLRVLNFSGSGLTRFPPNLPISLTNMILMRSKITELPSSIGKLENLKELDISLTGIKKLPASIGMLKSLEELDVSYCSSLEEIPPEIEGCTCLMLLYLRLSGVSELPSNLRISLPDLSVYFSESDFSVYYSESDLDTTSEEIDGSDTSEIETLVAATI